MRKIALVLTLAVLATSLYAQSLNDINRLSEELEAVGQKDQQIRSKLIEEGKKFQETGDKSRLNAIVKEKLAIDKANQAFVSRILNHIGWPKGLTDDASYAIFLVIDHAGLEYQKKYLDLVKSQSDIKAIAAGDYANLVDKILMKSGKRQEYGTQTVRFNGETHLWPVSEPDSLNQRRAEVGLEPIEDYFFVVESTYGNKINWDTTKTIEDIGITFR